MALGNGMQREVWQPFQRRFGIPQIAEFYASTEGNCNLVNTLGVPGVIGWIPPIARFVYPVRVVRFDSVEERPLRDAVSGFCSECPPGEVGELISRIATRDPVRAFDGYSNARATSDKILANVFAAGDRWFRSGDLVRSDESGRLYFVDRVGDTYRWKGENCSTQEVAAVMAGFQSTSRHPAPAAAVIKEVNVYGVQVTGNDGRAGMACITLEQPHDEQTQELQQRTESDNERETQCEAVEWSGAMQPL